MNDMIMSLIPKDLFDRYVTVCKISSMIASAKNMELEFGIGNVTKIDPFGGAICAAKLIPILARKLLQ